MSIEFLSEDEDETDRLGSRLARVLQPGDVVTLIGNLGSGKTRFVRSVVRELDADVRATSPTFVLIQEYPTSPPVAHLDAYRLADADELLALGFDELLESDTVVFVEWADRVAAAMPRDQLRVRIEVLGETRRRFLFSANGSRSQRILNALDEST